MVDYGDIYAVLLTAEEVNFKFVCLTMTHSVGFIENNNTWVHSHEKVTTILPPGSFAGANPHNLVS